MTRPPGCAACGERWHRGESATECPPAALAAMEYVDQADDDRRPAIYFSVRHGVTLKALRRSAARLRHAMSRARR